MTPRGQGHIDARTVPPVHQLVVAVQCSLERASRAVVAALTQRGFVAREDDSFAVTHARPQAHLVRRILAVDPRHLCIVTVTDDSALIEMPIAFLVMASHGGITVRCNDPAVTFAAYTGLAAFGEELSATCQRVLRAVIRECASASASSNDSPPPLALRIEPSQTFI